MSKKKIFLSLFYAVVMISVFLLGYPVGYYVLKSSASNLTLLKQQDANLTQGTIIYFINLDKSKDRHNHILSQVKKMDFPFERVSGVDGKGLSDQEIQEKVDLTTYKNFRAHFPLRGTIGCSLSHIKAWQTFLKSGYSYALILEDDVVFNPKHLSNLIKILTQKIEGWDIINLETRYLGFFFSHKNLMKENNWVLPLTLKTLENGDRVVLYLTEISHAGAYLLSRTAAQKLLNKALPIKMPIDNYFTKGWELDLVFMGIEPRPVTQNYFSSDYKSVIATTSGNYSFPIVDNFSDFKQEIYILQSSLIRFFYNLKIFVMNQFHHILNDKKIIHS